MQTQVFVFLASFQILLVLSLAPLALALSLLQSISFSQICFLLVISFLFSTSSSFCWDCHELTSFFFSQHTICGASSCRFISRPLTLSPLGCPRPVVLGVSIHGDLELLCFCGHLNELDFFESPRLVCVLSFADTSSILLFLCSLANYR